MSIDLFQSLVYHVIHVSYSYIFDISINLLQRKNLAISVMKLNQSNKATDLVDPCQVAGNEN